MRLGSLGVFVIWGSEELCAVLEWLCIELGKGVMANLDMLMFLQSTSWEFSSIFSHPSRFNIFF